MSKRVAATGVGVLLAAAGFVAVNRWHDTRVATCERRSADLSALEILGRGPDGYRPDSPVSGCDLDRVVAYSSRQFAVAGGPTVDRLAGQVAVDVDEKAVGAFYRQVLENGDWEISRPGTAGLCASKQVSFGRAYVHVSFPVAGAYEVMVADGSPCG